MEFTGVVSSLVEIFGKVDSLVPLLVIHDSVTCKF